MKVNKTVVAVAAAVMTFAAASCGKKKKEEASAPPASTVADLALSSTLNLSIPDKLAAASGLIAFFDPVPEVATGVNVCAPAPMSRCSRRWHT